MMAPIKRIGRYAFVLFCILFVWSICLASAQELYNLQTSMELRYNKPTLTFNQLEKIQKEEADHEKRLMDNLLACEQTQQVDLKNKNLDTNTRTTMIHVFGDIQLLISKQQIVSGEFIYQGDSEGAIISKKVAYDLWGSLDVVGKEFSDKNKDYIVRGILDEEVPAVIVQLSKADEELIKMSQLRVQFINSENIQRQLEILRGRYELEDTVVINLSRISIILSQIIYLPMWIVGIWGLIKLYKLLYDTYRYWVAALLLMLIIGIATWIIGRLMSIQFDIPSYLTPNQWSDFEFWSRLWEELRSNYLEVQSLPKYLPDLWREKTIRMVLGTWGISSIATVFALRKIDIRDDRELFIQVLVAIMISFITIMISYGVGLTADMPQAFWVMVPLFITIQYLCSNWKKLFVE